MLGDDHRGSAAVQTWGIARRDGAPFTEGRSELGKGFECRVRSRPNSSARNELHPFLAPNLDRDDFVRELSRLLRLAETLL